jgi:signal peptide peptidase-like protein 2B
MFCIGAFSSLTTCLDRLSYFAPIFRRYRIPSHTFRKPCTCQLGPLNVITLFAMIISLTLIITWYIYRQAEWAWVLQDLLGAAICITVTSVYRLGNMRVITLILLGFFLYDIFFVFITPYIPLFQPSNPTTTTTTTARPPFASTNFQTMETGRKISRSPSVMEQVALGIGTDGEVVPLLFALPMFIPEAETDPCITFRKSMLGFGDVILPVIEF